MPLAGKPPFATDEPESFYESAPHPQPRLRQPPPHDPNQRTSAYNLYDNYLDGDKNQLPKPPPVGQHRNSEVGALGMGLLNMEDSDSEDDDDNTPRKLPGITSSSQSKHAALAAAISPTTRPVQQRQQLQNSPLDQVPQQMRGPPPSSQPQVPPPASGQAPQQMRGPLPSNQPQAPPLPPLASGQVSQQMRGPPQSSQMPAVMPQAPTQQARPPPPNLQPGVRRNAPQPIAAPRPGYAAPIAALNLARPEHAANSAGRMPNPDLPQPLIHSPPRSLHSASPAPSAPHPLHPSITPITPAFIRPLNSKSPAPSSINVTFSEGVAIPRKPIMRGNSEETLLPGRGEKGDDFWRRFSMVAKEGGKGRSHSESSWLHQMRSGSNRYSRGVWVVAIFLLLLIAGGVALGLVLGRNAPANQQPAALGGSADSLGTSTSSVVTTSKAAGPVAPPGAPSQIGVSPTLTLTNREEPTPSSEFRSRHYAKHQLN